MEILDSLVLEHRLFERLLERLSKGMVVDCLAARGEVRDVLFLLSLALQRHEEIESSLDLEGAVLGKAALRAAAAVDRQHKEIVALQEDILRVLDEAPNSDWTRLGRLITRLDQSLRRHFRTEELEFWPQLGKLRSRSVKRSINRRLAERVKSLEDDIRKHNAVVGEYLGAGRR